MYRVDQRGYGVVRSDLELSQVMYELYEQEEVSYVSNPTSRVVVHPLFLLHTHMCIFRPQLAPGAPMP